MEWSPTWPSWQHPTTDVARPRPSQGRGYSRSHRPESGRQDGGAEDLPDERRPSEPDAVLDVRSTGLPTPQSDYARAELAVFYLGLLTLTEVVTIHVDPYGGIAGFAVLVVGLMVGA